MQVACEVQMALYGVAIRRRQTAQIPRGLDRHSEAFRAQEVTYALRAPDDHGAFGIGRHQYQDLVVLPQKEVAV